MIHPWLPRRDTLAAALSGLLLALAYPRPELAWLAWVGLVPLLLSMEKRPLHTGLTTGVVFFGLVLYWLNIVMTTYGGLHPVLSFAAYLMLVAYLSLFFLAATWSATRFKEHLGLAITLTLPVVWVALELARGWLLSGFPWALLGYSQVSLLPLVQSADLFGIYGISFLLVLGNAVAASLVRAARGQERLSWRSAAGFAVLFIANLGYGGWRLGTDLDARAETIRVALAQGNIAQGVKWDPAYQQETVRIYRELSLDAARRQAQLIIWPEAATPFYFQDDSPLSRQVAEVPARTGAHLLFGSPAYERANGEPRYLNSAFLLDPSAAVLGRSDKVHLVPFGEYVPLRPLLPFVDKLVVGMGDFSPGTLMPLSLDGRRLGVLVCYEAIFPHLARELVSSGSDLLVNITNDAWFGRSSAPYQHLAMTRLRAIENRVWIARAANTGISAFISPSGRVLEETAIFEQALALSDVGWGARPGLYTRFGDLFALLCVVLSLWWLARSRPRIR